MGIANAAYRCHSLSYAKIYLTKPVSFRVILLVADNISILRVMNQLEHLKYGIIDIMCPPLCRDAAESLRKLVALCD